MGFLAEAWFTGLPGGGPTQSPSLPAVPAIDVPFIADPMNTVEQKHWFLVSDLASVVEALFTDLSVLTLLGLVLIFGSIPLLWRTRFGLRLRSCGEAPAAAESLGVNVIRYKFIAVLDLGRSGRSRRRLPRPGLVRRASRWGRPVDCGYIGLAAMIFGNWRPGGLFMGAALFGYTEALPFRQGTVSVHALLLVVAVDPPPGRDRAAAPRLPTGSPGHGGLRRASSWPGTC